MLQVFDARGRSLAFVKIGGTEVTEALVRAEAASLQRLAEADLPAELEVPRLLHLGTWEGATVLAMTALDTSFLQRPRRQFDVPVSEMDRFHAAFAEEARPLVDSPLWDQMVSAQQSLGTSEVRERLGEALERLRLAATDRPLPLGGWHGDWTPWNMSRRRGRLQLWDCERFETGVPRGLDRCHYGVNAVTRRDGTDVASVMRGFELAGVHQRPRRRGPPRRRDLPRRHRLPLPRRRGGRPRRDHQREEPGDARRSRGLARDARGRASWLRPAAFAGSPVWSARRRLSAW